MSSFCPTFFTPLSSSLCRRVRNSAENEHTRHANKKCSPHPRLSEPRKSRISSELRRNHAVPRYVPLVTFRAESVEKFLFLFFCLFQAKRSQIWWPNGMRGSLVVYVARRRDGREMDEPFVSVQKYIRRENVCEERDTFAPLSLREAGFPRAREENQKLRLERKKARKNLKTGLFSPFAYPFLLSQKKQISHQILSYVYTFKHRLQSPRCAWLKTKT